MRHLAAVTIGLASLVFADVADAEPQAKQSRETVCHLTGDGDRHAITIAGAAVDRHLAHGDVMPGDAVPEMAGFVYDDNCEPVAAFSAELSVRVEETCLDPDNGYYGSWRADVYYRVTGNGWAFTTHGYGPGVEYLAVELSDAGYSQRRAANAIVGLLDRHPTMPGASLVGTATAPLTIDNPCS